MSRVLVTGASSGIGRAVALRLAARGDHVVLVARAEGPLAEVAAACERRGAGSAVAHPVDVLDHDGIERVVAETVRRLGAVDAVVHGAGVVAYGRFDQVPAEVWERVVRTNALGAANVARAVLPDMRGRNSGTIVFLGSVIGEIVVTGMSAYTVSKWALRSLGRSLQVDNRDRPGIRVSVVSLGSVDTPIYATAANYLGRPGRPPPPALDPDSVANRVVGIVDSPRKRVNVGATNWFMRFGFSVTPGLFDVLVGPMFRAVANGRTAQPPTSGNVLGPLPDAEAVRGGYGRGIAVVVRDLGSDLLRRLRRR